MIKRVGIAKQKAYGAGLGSPIPSTWWEGRGGNGTEAAGSLKSQPRLATWKTTNVA